MPTIRPAKISDAKEIALLLVQAMKDLALKYLNGETIDKAYPMFEHFIRQKNNLYSYENTFVFEDDDRIAGSITAYDGAKFVKLRQPVLDYLKNEFLFDSTPEEETTAGEFYLDTVSVFPYKQRKGVGSLLIRELIRYAADNRHKKVSLLVDKNNPRAKSLYEKIGFRTAETVSLLGGAYERLVYQT